MEEVYKPYIDSKRNSQDKEFDGGSFAIDYPLLHPKASKLKQKKVLEDMNQILHFLKLKE